jgi:hypothetical protein
MKWPTHLDFPFYHPKTGQRLQAMKKGTAAAQTLPGGADILANMSAVEKQRKVVAEQDAARSDDDEDMD